MTDLRPDLPAAQSAQKTSDAGFDAAQPEVMRVLRYWEALRGARPMPRRDEIDPRAIAPALEHLFIAEAVAPRVARLRLTGQHLSQLLGMEPRGMPLSALFEPEARDEIGLALAQVLTHGVRALVPLCADPGMIRPGLRGLLALMPIAESDAAGGGVKLLGVLEMRGMIGRAPRRLRIAGPLTALQPVEADAGLGDLSGTPIPAGTRPALRLIEGGRR